jgi:hypothetical protein
LCRRKKGRIMEGGEEETAITTSEEKGGKE